jgi:hypothetical protein
MGKFVQKLISVWIAAALLAAPLPTLSFAQAAPSGDHCMRDEQHAGHEQSISHHQQADSGNTLPDCTHCKKDSCDEGGCADQNCSFFNSPTTFMATFDSWFSAVSEIFSLTAPDGLSSRTAPPLLRPPS